MDYGEHEKELEALQGKLNDGIITISEYNYELAELESFYLNDPDETIDENFN